ncbi:MAG: bifunctional oligoribonuclease/PAP phosphatase NrnA [Candidatus Omnitrophota bacterium]
MDRDCIKQTIEALRNNDNFLITAHVNPEGDSIGSQIAVYYLLKSLKKKALIVNHDRVPDNLKFLAGAEVILNDIPEDFIPETIVVLDCPVKERAGSVSKNILDCGTIINIDHHVSNEFFGDVNWVESSVSSVGEMVFYLFKEMQISFNKEVIEAIYTAIVTDTGMFNYNNTSNETHKVAGELIAAGVNPKEMHGKIFENKSISDIRLLGRALADIRLEAGGRIAFMTLTQKMYEEEGVEEISTDEFINFPRSLKGVEIAVFLKENSVPEKINVSFRSKGKVDVNMLASKFGGGGHAQASGCILNYVLEEARKRILEESIKALGS